MGIEPRHSDREHGHLTCWAEFCPLRSLVDILNTVKSSGLLEQHVIPVIINQGKKTPLLFGGGLFWEKGCWTKKQETGDLDFENNSINSNSSVLGTTLSTLQKLPM